MSKKKLLIVLAVVVFGISAFFVFNKIEGEQEITPLEMMEKIENALGDECKKQSMTEVVATLVYGDGIEEHNINYHILKTTFYEADPSEVTGLNIDALKVLFDPEYADSCKEMKVQDWDAALYEVGERSYLCWTYSPEVSYVLEYNPDAVTDADVIKMAESAAPIEKD